MRPRSYSGNPYHLSPEALSLRKVLFETTVKILLDHDDASDEKRQYHEIERSQAIIGPHWSPQSAGSLQTLAATICDDVDALG